MADMQPDIRFYHDVQIEVAKARAKFPGVENMTLAHAEEAGELTKAMLDHHYGKATDAEVYSEAVQAAAMALRVAVEGDASLSYRGSKD